MGMELAQKQDAVTGIRKQLHELSFANSSLVTMMMTSPTSLSGTSLVQNQYSPVQNTNLGQTRMRFDTRPDTTFDEMDKNKDGVISREEFYAPSNRMMQLHRG